MKNIVKNGKRYYKIWKTKPFHKYRVTDVLLTNNRT